MKRIAIASDHAGYKLKEELRQHLLEAGYRVEDFGCHSEEPVDYPDYILPAAESVATGGNDLGIVLGGSGNGEAMVANKLKGIRCGVCWNAESARLTKEHNNANVISIGARMTTPEKGIQIVQAWLTAQYEGGRHDIRLAKMHGIHVMG